MAKQKAKGGNQNPKMAIQEVKRDIQEVQMANQDPKRDFQEVNGQKLEVSGQRRFALISGERARQRQLGDRQSGTPCILPCRLPGAAIGIVLGLVHQR